MEYNIRILDISTEKQIISMMNKIGADIKGIALMSPKAIHRVIKLENVKLPTALILKQEMLSLGGEAVLSKDAILLKCQTTDMLLMGTTKHYQRLITKLKDQYFGLSLLGEAIETVLNNIIKDNFKITCGRYELDLSKRTYIMGILNVTPDSFSDGGRYDSLNKAVKRAWEMKEKGADIIDIGGESTRPGSTPCSCDEELNRVLPVVKAVIKGNISLPISIDTYKSEVAKACLDEGVDIINDISALRFDVQMGPLIASHKNVGVILMHIQGIPQTMQASPHYECLIGEIMRCLDERINFAGSLGIKDIIIDPGIGFGKTVDDNLKILHRLKEFKGLGKPILIGTSRKSFIGNVLDLPVEERLYGTAATIAASILNGANIIRVHDVKPMSMVAKMVDEIRYSSY